MDVEHAHAKYLELLKRAILFEIWQEYETDLAWWNHGFDRERHQKGEIWPQIAHSMIGRYRMNNLQGCMTSVVKDNIPGDFIETGVWRGGACIFMSGFLDVMGITDRNVWVADSFEGLPKPNEEKYPKDKGDTHHTVDYLRVSLEDVKHNFNKYDLLNDNVHFLKGWFKDTLPSAPIEQLAILRLDGDLYESTMDSLNNLYDKVSPGGYIIIDDFILPGCNAAIMDYRAEHHITEPLIPIDSMSVYWRKK
ncbi:TylF/MycF family methyltransferase [Geomicrobium sp. JSM 1781026]|uniref:TylF/MycF family methyltransferase n=1 Tax=Geomicrobium sp. JSM 1781026 TaxID=3344580 RepID=UPI0035C1597F